METAEMTPRARWARAQVEPFLAAHPDGMVTPVTLVCQHLDDIGALLDPDRATEIAADARAEVLRLTASRPGVDVAAAEHKLAVPTPPRAGVS